MDVGKGEHRMTTDLSSPALWTRGILTVEPLSIRSS